MRIIRHPQRNFSNVISQRSARKCLFVTSGGICLTIALSVLFPEEDIQSASSLVSGNLARLDDEQRIWSKGSELRGVYRVDGYHGCDTSSDGTSCTLHFPLGTRAHAQSNILHITRAGQKGRGRQENQDRSMLATIPGQGMLAALFDGHGDRGQVSAETAVRDLPFRLLQELTATEVLTADTVTKAFLNSDQLQRNVPSSGSTALVTWQVHRNVTLASLGDSTGLVVRCRTARGECQTVLESVKHKPADRLERERIESAGGLVLLPPAFNPKVTSRVVFPASQNGFEMGLAMSRSLGDWDGKVPGFLIAEPSHASIVLEDCVDCFYFVLLASDGVVDQIPKAQLLEIVGNAFRSEDKSQVTTAGNEVLQIANAGWAKETMGQYRDDMSLLAVRLSDWRAAT